MLQRNIQLKAMISGMEKESLKQLATLKGVSKSDVIRLLLRDEAERLGVWPEVTNGKVKSRQEKGDMNNE